MTDTYVDWLASVSGIVSTPKLPKSTHTFSISLQAYEGLQRIAESIVDVKPSRNMTISHLLEAIGTNQLTVSFPISLVQDTKFGRISTTECFEAGMQDAEEGRPANFELIFSEYQKLDTIRFYKEAYMRGYLQFYKTESEK